MELEDRRQWHDQHDHPRYDVWDCHVTIEHDKVHAGAVWNAIVPCETCWCALEYRGECVGDCRCSDDETHQVDGEGEDAVRGGKDSEKKK